MKRFSPGPAVGVTLVCVALCGPAGLLGSDASTPAHPTDPSANDYGRAGGPVGAAAIEAASRDASPAGSAPVQWPGRAGTLAGTTEVGTPPRGAGTGRLPANAFEDWYGRAGGPVGVPPAARGATAEIQKDDYVSLPVGPSVRSGAAGTCVRTGTWAPGAQPCETQVAEQRPKPVAEVKPAPTPPPQVEAPKPPPPAPVPTLAQQPVPPQPAPAPPPPVAKVPEQPAARPPELSGAALHITLDAQTHFSFDNYKLTPAGEAKMDQLLAALAQKQYDSIVVTGHADRLGSDAYNETLSERRALSVKQYLVKKGVDEKKIEARGVGAAEPVTTPDACEGLDRAKMIQCLAPDRRAELMVVGARGR